MIAGNVKGVYRKPTLTVGCRSVGKITRFS